MAADMHLLWSGAQFAEAVPPPGGFSAHIFLTRDGEWVARLDGVSMKGTPIQVRGCDCPDPTSAFHDALDHWMAAQWEAEDANSEELG